MNIDHDMTTKPILLRPLGKNAVAWGSFQLRQLIDAVVSLNLCCH